MPSRDNILIYRLGSLGDTVIALPCFHFIRKRYPQSRITLLTNQPVSGKAAPAMAILDNTGLCDQAIHYPVGARSLSQLAPVRRQIRELRPQLLINLSAARGFLKSLRDELFFRSCGVTHIVGTPFKPRDLRVARMANGDYEAEAERLAARLQRLGTIDLSDLSLWDLNLTPMEQQQGLALLPDGQKEFVAVSVGTKLPTNDWGQENWQRFLKLLSAAMPDATLILLGANDEAERSAQLALQWQGPTLNLCGKTSPRISAVILKKCRLFVGHDSGPMHLASAMGVTTLGLFSWFNPPGQWFPGHRSWEFIRIHYPPLPPGGWHAALRMKRSASEGIGLLQPESVFQSARELLRLAPRKPADFATPILEGQALS